ncbi:hypothetical protein [Pseudomonas brassicacearum]|uniref:hypothetical protein n=1 Tax=Pseudomonas brassicacearum TaxID=930166 RepID=UPI003D64FCBF
MPTENKPIEPRLDLNTPDGGRGFIASLFKAVLKRHDYRQYIDERLAGDFACTLAQHIERITAERDALQLLLNERDEQVHSLEQRRQAEQQAGQAAEREAVRYRFLRKVTPYRFKKMQDAATTDGGDVFYFHADRFDAAIDALLNK